jgi:hypothetical protein
VVKILRILVVLRYLKVNADALQEDFDLSGHRRLLSVVEELPKLKNFQPPRRGEDRLRGQLREQKVLV